MKKKYEEELFQFLVEKDFHPNWFYTLLGTKWNPIYTTASSSRLTTGDDLRDAYLVATRMLEKRLYGKYNEPRKDHKKRRRQLLQLPVIETSRSGSVHLHILAKLDAIEDVKITGLVKDSYSWHMKDVWKRMKVCSKVGNFDSLGLTNFDKECQWSQSIYDAEGLTKYVSKQINDERGVDICFDLFAF